eukprot:CAMPEP_0118710782 /NCGR_PEP_ID=MMETSP0800-20121206/23627_1 /TAXON_ID=210618 ORGANISM="Striatella unipunctata, Strain CCMP2910" /NCGR_SAMPLE_ID=MMETSP0800 /ASSEMBLY_ACC=CAM_ASM_000638 /LENGTH=524 /DNA_ID=CAMNT_0006615111 /DNA_START=306 /DNA_END=1881 /DNA_ORIENTATION=-
MAENATKRQLELQLRDKDETIASLSRARIVERQSAAEVQRELENLKAEHMYFVEQTKISHDDLKKKYKQTRERLEQHLDTLMDGNLMVEFQSLLRETTPYIARISNSEVNKAKQVGITNNIGDTVEDITKSTATSLSGDDDDDDDEEEQTQPNNSDSNHRNIENDDNDDQDEQAKIILPESYLLRLQQKLAKAMHRMHVMKQQMSQLEKQSKKEISSVKSQYKRDAENKIKSEVELMNQLTQLEHEKKMAMQTLLAKLEVKQERISRLEEMLEEIRSHVVDIDDEDENRNKQEELPPPPPPPPLASADGSMPRDQDDDDDAENLEDKRESQDQITPLPITPKSEHSPKPTVSPGNRARQKIDQMVAVAKMREQIDVLTREKSEMESSYKKISEDQRAELAWLVEANKTKQLKLDEYIDRFGNVDDPNNQMRSVASGSMGRQNSIENSMTVSTNGMSVEFMDPMKQDEYDEDEAEGISDVMENAQLDAELNNLMNRLALATNSMENDLRKSLAIREKVLKDLEDE